MHENEQKPPVAAIDGESGEPLNRRFAETVPNALQPLAASSANPIAAIVEVLRQGERFLVCSHSRPDGDAVGSMLATGMLLSQMGKRHVPELAFFADRSGRFQARIVELMTRSRKRQKAKAE